MTKNIKRKITSAALLLCSILGCLVLNMSVVNATSVKLGDANADGTINAKDASAVLSYYSTTMIGGTYDKNIVIAAADVDANDSINAKDATAILREYAKALTTKGYKPFNDKVATEPETVPPTTEEQVAVVKLTGDDLKSILKKTNREEIADLIDKYATEDINVVITQSGDRIIATVTFKEDEAIINISKTEYDKILSIIK